MKYRDRRELERLKKLASESRPSLKRRLIGLMINIFFIILASISLYVFFVFIQMPSLDSMLNETRLPTITFVDSVGREIRSSNKIMGTPVSVETLPPYVWQSIVAIEDKRFFKHGAVDMRGLARAMVSNLRSGHVTAGGSSLSQQTAKNIFLSRKRTASRKIQELILAHWLEKRFNKNQILDLYMNRVVLVGNLRGIDAAARELFDKPATKLTLAEASQIAAMLKAPTSYNPIRNPDRNIARARLVLTKLVQQKYITLSQARSAAKELKPRPITRTDTNIFRYWTDFVSDEISSRMGDKIDSDLIVWTTLDTKLQENAARVLRSQMSENRDKSVDQGAVLAISRDGAIRAMVGGKDYQASQFNRTLALRQPGSIFKSVVYLVALENGMTPDSMVNDSQFSIGDYNPKNYNERYYGDITLATAFAKSANSVPLKLTQVYGLDNVLSMAGRLGVGAKLRREYSTILGASEMSLMDLVTLSGVIWNDGISVRPYSITKITTTADKVLYSRSPSEPMVLLQPDTVNYMHQMMASVTSLGGTGNRANVPDVTLGGKTGTSSDYRDAWFIGATPELTIGVWVGNDNFSPMDKITGGTIPADIFKDIVK